MKMECADISSWHALYRMEKGQIVVNRTKKWASKVKDYSLS